MNLDKLTNIPTRQAANATMSIIDCVQRLQPEERPVALAASFLLLAERLDVPAQDLFTYSTNIMNHADGRRPEFKAVADYLENEL